MRTLFLGREYPIDLGVIDLGLPGLSGIALIRALRKLEKRFPILILTARDSWQDKVEGLESGADDYLTKPSISRSWLPASMPCCAVPAAMPVPRYRCLALPSIPPASRCRSGAGPWN